MLCLKELNIEDADKEYDAIKNILPNENGFTNEYYDSTKEEFVNKIIPKLLDYSRGINL